MIDLHSHIAWEIDDGMPSEEDALLALDTAKKDGIKVICSTPHIMCGNISNSMLKYIRQRQRECRQLSKDVKICYGCELFLNDDVDQTMDQKLFFTLNDSRYVLVEFDVTKDIHEIDYKWYINSVVDHGYTVVLAHVERYFKKGLDYDILSFLQSRNVVFQINRTSLMNLHGARNYQNCMELLNKRMVHVVASDTHRSSGSRIAKLSDAYQHVMTYFGKENADRLFVYNAFHILNDEKVESMGM